MKKIKKPERESAQWLASRRFRERGNRSDYDFTRRDTDRISAVKNDLAGFCKSYLPHRFPLDFSADHLDALGRMSTAVLRGGFFANAAPRGDGKTERAIAMALWAVLMGHKKFAVIVAADAAAAKNILAEIAYELAQNDLFLADFPEACQPFAEIFHNRLRADFVQFGAGENYAHTGAKMKTDQITFAAHPDYAGASDGAIIAARGLTAGLRGMRAKGAGGVSIRPDIVIVDDPQTDESAASPEQVRTREELFAKAVLGLAGPKNKISGVVNCTTIAQNDLADRLLNNELHPELRGKKYQLVKQWPDADKTLWAQYGKLYLAGLRDGDGGKAASDFYNARRAEMDAGAVVSWPARYRDGEISALQCAYNLLFAHGEAAFFSEYQNDPRRKTSVIFEITPKIIAARASGFARREAPREYDTITIGCDINFAGMKWVALAARRDGAAAIIDYGKHPENKPLIDRKKTSGEPDATAIALGIRAVADMACALECDCGGVKKRAAVLGIDCGFFTDSVLSTISAARMPIKIIPVRGRASSDYRIPRDVRHHGQGWHLAKWNTYDGVCVINADMWREQMQRAWLLPFGVPGSVGFFGNAKEHAAFFDELCAEQMVEHVSGAKGEYYRWHRKPGAPNDWADALSYAAALCGVAGCSVLPMSPEKQRQTVRPNVRTFRPPTMRASVPIDI